jgi:predicted ArsR family transcriptional regulator
VAELDWERITRAALHPTQQALMDLLAGGRVAAPVDLEAELGEPLGAINYHMRRLAARGWVRLVRTEPRRGATKHFYVRTDVSPGAGGEAPEPVVTDWEALARETLHPIQLQVLCLLADGRVASPTDLAPELGLPLSNLSYHIRRLAAWGLLRPAGGEPPGRGATRHHYRSAVGARRTP